MAENALLLAAIEDNVSWCSAMCTSHHSDERITARVWANLVPSPLYYPNLITRLPHSQPDIAGYLEKIRENCAPETWAIKDSFRDLDLSGFGFEPVIEGQWFGLDPAPRGRRGEHLWQAVRTAEELSHWETAWNADGDRRLFKDVLLADMRVRFWMLRHDGEIVAGCISFASETAIGLSNWFSRRPESVFELGLLGPITDQVWGKPIVFWTDEPAASFAGFGFKPLGPLRVWMTQP